MEQQEDWEERGGTRSRRTRSRIEERQHLDNRFLHTLSNRLIIEEANKEMYK